MTILLNLIPTFFLVFLASIARSQQKSWLAPGSFFILICTLYVAAPILFAPGFDIWHGAIWWILLCAVVLYMGSVLGMSIRLKRKKCDLNLEFINSVPFKNLRNWTLFCSVIGIIGLLYYIKVMGFSLNIFASLESLGKVSSGISNARYTEGYSQPALYNIALMLNYLGGFLGGMLWQFQKSKVAYFPFVPIVLTIALTTTKSVIIFITFFWIGGFLASKVLMKEEKIFTPKIVLGGISVGFALNILFVVYSMLRYNTIGIRYLGFIYEKLTDYYFGYLPAFSQWFKQVGYSLNELLWGQMTFAGVWDLLGVERAQGIYDKFITIDYETGKSTNIYTVFRFFIDDFGLFGCLIAFFIIGILAGIAYRQVSNGRIIFMPMLMVFYAQTLFSNTTSLFSYNTLILAWVLTSLYLVYISIPNFKRVVIWNSKKSKNKRMAFKKYTVKW